MNTDNQSLQDKAEWVSIDDPNLKWRPFILSMLRIGRILTKRENRRTGITGAQISRLMNKHRSELPDVYTGREIRDQFEYYGCWLVGGGIQISGDEMPVPYRGPKQYYFTIERLQPPEAPSQIETAKAPTETKPEPAPEHEPPRTTA